MSQTSVPIEELEPIDPTILQVGNSLPYNLYNARGKFISAKDYVFKNDHEIAMVSHSKPMRLKTDGALHRSNPSETTDTHQGNTIDTKGKANVISYGNGKKLENESREYGFTRKKLTNESQQQDESKLSVVSLIERLVDLFPDLYEAFQEAPESAPALLSDMEKRLFKIIDKDVDAAIGIVHIAEIKTQAEHCIYAAILAAIYARTIGYPHRYVRLVALSAICMNLGAIKLHHELNESDSELSEGLLAEIRKHSEASVELIAKSGIRHPTIINAILHHHERPDGEGYPLGLNCQEIPDEALIIGIVDTYLAMIGPRAYRPKVQPKEALKQVLFEGHKYDNDFYTTFIKAIGVYPAGTFHELTNGQIAMVVRRDPSHATKPHVCVLMNERGVKENSHIVQKLSAIKHGIKAPHPRGKSLAVNPLDIWN